MLLSDLDDASLDARFPPEQPLPQLAPGTITDPVALKAAISKIRQQGYAFDYEESTPGLCCVAAPVYDATKRMVAAMSIAVPSIRFTTLRREELLALVCAQARSLSQTLGYHAVR
jgi:DNA-binding IclR family transcriptional regulator